MNLDFSAIELRDYGMSLGWTLVKEALKDQLFVLNSPNKDYRQLAFPYDETDPSFQEMAKVALVKLEAFTGRNINVLIDEIREVNDDVLSIRFFSETKNVNSLSFEEAVEAIESTKQMILAAGSSISNPGIYHPKLNRSAPKELLRKTRFRHTHEGSFILRISSPFEGTIDPQTDLFGTNHLIPFGRKSFEWMSSSAQKIQEAIQTDSIADWIEIEKNASIPMINYNFCDALLGLFDEQNELPFELNFQWSRNSIKHGFPIPASSTKTKFPYSIKSKIQEVKQRIEPVLKNYTGEIFIGTVESLNGEEGLEGRQGEVTLSLLVDGEIVKAKANLTADQYRKAHDAHIQIGGQGYIKINGQLTSGRRVKTLEQITEFDLASP